MSFLVCHDLPLKVSNFIFLGGELGLHRLLFVFKVIKLLGEGSLLSERFLGELEHFLAGPRAFFVGDLEAVEALLEHAHVLTFKTRISRFSSGIGLGSVILVITCAATIIPIAVFEAVRCAGTATRG